MKITMIIKIVEKGNEIQGPLRQAILDSRSELCEILNGENGAIEKYNKLTEMLLFDTSSNDEYIDTYERLVNHCWTKLLNKKGCRYTIISEVMYDTKTNPILRMKGIDYVTKIKIAKQ